MLDNKDLDSAESNRKKEREREKEGGGREREKEREEPMKRGQEILPAACPLERMERACQ